MEKYYTIGEFAEKIGKSKNTLRKWDEEGKLKPHHITSGKHRIYSEAQLKEVLEYDWKINSNNYTKQLKDTKKVAAYCRCSETSTEQDLEYKLNVLKVYLDSKGYDSEVYKECKNELATENTELEKMIKEILNGNFEKVVVQSKEDLSVVHLSLIKLICEHTDTELEIVDKESVLNSNKFLKEALDFADSIKA